jgi:hypothetical protein
VFAESAIDLKFFGGEFLQHLMVASAVAFGDEGSEFALTAFELTVGEGVECIFDLLGHRLGAGLCV